jgi:hypothetical protein
MMPVLLDAGPLLGSWRLVSWRIQGEDGQDLFPLGANPDGLLVYAPDGYMFAALMAPGRPGFLGGDPLRGTAEESLSAMRGYHTYCGRYRIEDGRVLHAVEVALCPNLIGSEQVRYYRLEDDRLILTTPPQKRAGVTGQAELIWRRPAADSDPPQ